MDKMIEAMKRSGMTAGEKARLRAELFASIENGNWKETPVSSPYLKHFGVPSRFHFSWKTFGKIGAVSALSLLFVMGGLTYASGSALPGDLLYPIKINLKEGIEDKLTFAPAQKIALREKRIQERFTEMEKLIKENKVTPETLSIVNSEIQVEKEKINSDIEEINKGNPQAAEEAKQNLQTSIDARQDKIGSQIKANDDLNSINDSLSNFKDNLNNEYQAESKLLSGEGDKSASGTESLPSMEDGNSASSKTDAGVNPENDSSGSSETNTGADSPAQ